MMASPCLQFHLWTLFLESSPMFGVALTHSNCPFHPISSHAHLDAFFAFEPPESRSPGPIIIDPASFNVYFLHFMRSALRVPLLHFQSCILCSRVLLPKFPFIAPHFLHFMRSNSSFRVSILHTSCSLELHRPCWPLIIQMHFMHVLYTPGPSSSVPPHVPGAF